MVAVVGFEPNLQLMKLVSYLIAPPRNKLVAPGGFEPPRTIVFETIASASFALIHGAITLGSLCVPV